MGTSKILMTSKKSSAKQWDLTILLKVVYELHAGSLILVKGIHQLVQL